MLNISRTATVLIARLDSTLLNDSLRLRKQTISLALSRLYTTTLSEPLVYLLAAITIAYYEPGIRS